MLSDGRREALRELLRVEAEMKRRRRVDRLKYYNVDKVHAKQVEFHKSCCRNRWVFGGNRSGKSECGAAEVAYMARGCHPYRENRHEVHGWVVSLTQQMQRDVAQAKLLSFLNPDWIVDVVMHDGSKKNPASGVIDFILVKTVTDGVSKIGFRTVEQGRERFQGVALDFVWFDEEPTKEVYDECLMRVMDRKGDIFGTMTPLKGLTWVYNDIYLSESKDIFTVFMEWADNPFLDRHEVERMSAMLGKEELDSRRFGRFSESKGLVYPEFDPSVHVIEPFDVPVEWLDKASIDPGLSNPLSCHFYAVDGDGTVYVVAEHYKSQTDIGTHAECIKRIALGLGVRLDSFGRVPALIDSASNQRTLASSKSVAELFYDYGIAVNCKVNKDVFAGIARVKEFLIGDTVVKKPKLYIFSSCVNMIREFKGYYFGDGDVPKKKDDHAMDELRYYIMSRPERFKPAVEKGLIEGELEKRLRRRRKVRKV